MDSAETSEATHQGREARETFPVVFISKAQEETPAALSARAVSVELCADLHGSVLATFFKKKKSASIETDGCNKGLTSTPQTLRKQLSVRISKWKPVDCAINV